MLDTALEREMNTAQEYSSSLWFQRNSTFQQDHRTIVLLHHSFCICEIFLDICGGMKDIMKVDIYMQRWDFRRHSVLSQATVWMSLVVLWQA